MNTSNQPWWDRQVHAGRRANLAVRTQVIAALRVFFGEHGFTEVDTGILQVSPGLDRHVRPLAVNLHGPFDLAPLPRYLHTSPEFAMKKLLAAGEQKIFQISHVFRDAEESRLHQPEFTLLEWYRTDADYTALMSDVENLIASVAKAADITQLKHGTRSMAVAQAWARMSVAEAFETYAGINLLETIDDGFDPAAESLRRAAGEAGIECDTSHTWDDIFHRILLERIEPALTEKGGVFLYDYPAVVGALARSKDTDPRITERVEAYACGVELANGFSELTDHHEQRRRFERDMALYQELYGSPPPIDDGFLNALENMPPSAGMALGIDRLVMLLTGAAHIRDVQWAPLDLSQAE